MTKYTVSCDLLVPVLLEIEADNEDAAELQLFEMSKRRLLQLANTEEDAIGISEASITIDHNDPDPNETKRTADRIDGYDRDDLGESPDY